MFRTLAVSALLLTLAACSRCGKQEPASAGEVTRFLPADAELLVVVQSAAALGQRVSVLEGLKVASFAAQLQGMPDAHAYGSALMGELGVDLRSAEAIAEAGIDPHRPLGVAFLSDQSSFAVIPLKEEKKLREKLRAFAQHRLGASEVKSEGQGGLAVTSFARPSGPAVLGYLAREGHALVAAQSSLSKLSSFAQVPVERALASSQSLRQALARLPKERDLWVHLPPTSRLVQGTGIAGATVTARLGPDALTLVADLPWSKPGLIELLARKEGPELLPLLPTDAFLVARHLGEPARLAPYWDRLVGPYLERAFREAGFDVKAEILENLKPGASFALSLAPEAKLGGAMPAFDVRRTNPFRYVHLTVVAEARDAQKMQATLEKMPAVAPRFGAKVEPTERAGRRVFLSSYAQGEGVHFAAAENRAVLAAPLSRLEEALERLASVGSTPSEGPLADPELRKPFQQRAAALVIDLRRLAESVKALPADAYGVGGFAIKATYQRWLEATDDLRAVVFALDAKEGALQAELTLRITPQAARAEKQ